jgi:hypothetical protein
MSADPRQTLARPDLAARALEGRVTAAAYVDPSPMVCRVPTAALRTASDDDARQEDQLLFGELFDVLETKDGWLWGQARRDGYVGFARASGFQAPGDPPTHRVSALRAYAFSGPDLLAPPAGLYSLNALVCVEAQDGRFLRGQGAGWFVESHLAALGDFESDPAAVAERYLGAPYLWGGRDSLGLDCSGLLQQALYACGLACPRDTDLQFTALGAPAPAGDLKRGDLVFWDGHVGMMLDDTRLIHANGRDAATAIQPLSEAIEQIMPLRGAPVGFRRL